MPDLDLGKTVPNLEVKETILTSENSNPDKNKPVLDLSPLMNESGKKANTIRQYLMQPGRSESDRYRDPLAGVLAEAAAAYYLTGSLKEALRTIQEIPVGRPDQYDIIWHGYRIDAKGIRSPAARNLLVETWRLEPGKADCFLVIWIRFGSQGHVMGWCTEAELTKNPPQSYRSGPSYNILFTDLRPISELWDLPPKAVEAGK